MKTSGLFTPLELLAANLTAAYVTPDFPYFIVFLIVYLHVVAVILGFIWWIKSISRGPLS